MRKRRKLKQTENQERMKEKESTRKIMRQRKRERQREKERNAVHDRMLVYVCEEHRPIRKNIDNI